MKRLVILLILLPSCGVIDGLRGHNIHMARDALQALKQPIDDHYEEQKAKAETEEELAAVEKQHLTATYDMADLDRRLCVAQRDFPAPETPKGEEPVKRSTIEEVSKEDEFRFSAYSGLVAKKQAWRNVLNALRAQLKKLGKVWDRTIWGLTIAIYVVIALIAYIVIRKLRWVYLFLSNLLDELGLDKDAKRRLAAGTPVEAAHRKKQQQARKQNGSSSSI
jgi:hypothetical protein